MVYIIGSGVMGSAIAKVLAKKGQKVFVYDTSFAKAALLAKQKNISADKNLNNLAKADFIVVAVKPYHISDVNLRAIKPSAVLVSIAAGVSLSKLQKFLAHKKIVRTMPNLGLSVGQGIMAWKSTSLSPKEKLATKKLLNLISENFEVKNESLIDSFTAIAGSGPAYFFLLAWCLEQSAKKLGFNPAEARMLAEKTLNGASALQSGKSYEQLIKAVMSKKGTTEAAFGVFKKAGLDKIVNKAAQAAFNRAKEISNE